MRRSRGPRGWFFRQKLFSSKPSQMCSKLFFRCFYVIFSSFWADYSLKKHKKMAKNRTLFIHKELKNKQKPWFFDDFSWFLMTFDNFSQLLGWQTVWTWFMRHVRRFYPTTHKISWKKTYKNAKWGQNTSLHETQRRHNPKNRKYRKNRFFTNFRQNWDFLVFETHRRLPPPRRRDEVGGAQGHLEN